MNQSIKAFKTALSVAICLIIAKIYKIESPFYVVLPSLFLITDDPFYPLTSSINRLIGTIIACVIAIAFTLLAFETVLFTALGVALIIYFTNYFKFTQVTFITCLIFISIMLSNKDNIVIFSINRLLYTGLGIIVTLSIDKFILSQNPKVYFYNFSVKFYDDLLSRLKDLLLFNEKQTLHSIDTQLDTIKQQFNKYYKKGQDLDKFKEMFDALVVIYERLKDLHFIEPNNLVPRNREYLFKLLNIEIKTSYMNKDENIYNYFIGKIIESIEVFNKLKHELSRYNS